MSKSVFAEVARVVAQNLALVGMVAGFWHIHWIAGAGMLAGALVGVAVYSAGYWDPRDAPGTGSPAGTDQEPTPREGEEPGEPES
jgi:hypothetical protein